MKVCNKCKILKDLEFFRISGKYYRGQCKECEKFYYVENKEIISNRRKIYKEENKIRLSEKSKEYREKNKEKRKDIWKKYKVVKSKYKKRYREINSDKEKEYRKEYRNRESVKIREKEYRKEYNIKNREILNNKRNNDPLLKLKHTIRSIIYRSISECGYKKSSKTEKILGCTFEEFKEYLESKFESWMTWENRGLYNGQLNNGWDIDHIVPLSSAENEEDIIKLNNFNNLQPLCSYTNRYIKGIRLDYEMSI